MSLFSRFLGRTSSTDGLIEKFLKDKLEGGLLSTLTPLAASQLAKVQEGFPGLPAQYLTFTETIGVGAALGERFYIYEPHYAAEYIGHQSYQLYNSDNSKNLFGRASKQGTIGDDLVAVADTGSSWRYCLTLGGKSAVLCLVFHGPEVVPEADDFFTFVDRLITDMDELNPG